MITRKILVTGLMVFSCSLFAERSFKETDDSPDRLATLAGVSCDFDSATNAAVYLTMFNSNDNNVAIESITHGVRACRDNECETKIVHTSCNQNCGIYAKSKKYFRDEEYADYIKDLISRGYRITKYECAVVTSNM